ncbi:MAG: peptidase M19 [Alphaproteobacteria bacterium]|nr:MAG: peptidase M19 [Alphaproteobacteria bacterium]
MFRKFVMGLAGLIVLALVLAAFFLPPYLESTMNKVEPHAPYPISEDAAALHRTLVIGDLHSDSLLWKRNIAKRSRLGHVDIPRLQDGNVFIQIFPAVTKSPKGQNYDSNTSDSDNITLLAVAQMWPPRTWTSLTERALFQSEKLHRLATHYPDDITVIRTANDLAVALARRQDNPKLVAAVLAIEGSHALDQNLDNVRTLHEAGYRLFGLHHFFDNALGGSLHGTSKSGLTDFGEQVVRAIEAEGAIIDVAHSSEASVRDVLSIATRPIILSHTGFNGACQSPRNISDELMVQIAEKGGLIGVGYWDGAVCDPSPESIVRNIRHGINLVGVSHVALGSDYDGTTTTTFDTSEIVILTQTMLEQGFTDEEIRAVMGENLLAFLLENLPQ